MSWRSGAQLFGEMWPLLQARIPDRGLRQEFLGRLLALFLEWDVDPETIADLHPEVRQALAVLGVDVAGDPPEGDEVAGCVRQLASPEEKARVTAAQAIESFVHQAPVPARAAGVALRGLVGALRDASPKVRRAAANSIESLLKEKFALPGPARPGLEEALADPDEVVRKRVARAIKRIAASGKRAGRPREG
jgi:hypothetical protein